jgi:hypothetical protein
MEQRVNSLEEELKVLKSQIKAVLLDIKDYMSTGTAQPYTPVPSGGHTEVGPVPAASGGYHEQEVHVESPRGEVDHVAPHKAGTGVIGTALSQGNGDRVGASSRSAEKQSAGQADGSAQNGSRDDQVLDLLTVSVLAQWLARAMPAVGREQLGKLVEIYDITGNMQPRLKDTMLLLADLCAGDNPEVGPATAEAVPAAVSVQLLIELDGLLRCRNGAVESVVMSMLLDRAEGTKKDGHG